MTEPHPDTTELRELTHDPRAMRAMAHPVRLALLEALLLEGPLTATRAAELLDESPGNMSWHLQTLAKYGFVTEAGGGRGRARPWRLATLGTRWSTDESTAPEEQIAADALTGLLHERQFQRLREWEAARSSFPLEWQQASFNANAIAYLTADELRELQEQCLALLMSYRNRLLDPAARPEGAQPVELVAYGHPMRRPAADG